MEIWYIDPATGAMVQGYPPPGVTSYYDGVTGRWYTLTNPADPLAGAVDDGSADYGTQSTTNTAALNTNSPLAIDPATEAALRQEQEQRYDLANVNPHVNPLAIADGVEIEPYMYDQGIYGGSTPPPATIPVDDGYGGSGRSRRGGGSSGGGSGGGSSDDTGFFRGRDPMSNIPAYADGRVHPAVSGEPLTPGGRFNDGSSGGYGRANVTGGGSTNRYYRPGSGRRYNTAPGNTFGAGRPDMPYAREQALNRYYGIRNQVMAGLPPMLGGGGGTATDGTATGGGGGGGGRGSAAPGETGTRRLRGWARRQGYNPTWLHENVYSNPEYLLPDIIPGLDPGDPMYNQLNNQLMDQIPNLWSMTAGARRNNMGDPDQYANWLNRTIDQVSTPGGSWFNRNQLMRGIFNPQRKSAQWMGRQGGDTNEQLDLMQSQLGTTAYLTMAPQAADAFMAYVDATAAKYQNQISKRKPNNVPDPYKWVSRRVR